MPFFKTQSITSIEVRATLALFFTLGMTVGFFMGIVSTEAYSAVAGMAISWYFSKRTTEENGKNPV
jgi:hypothetical protein